MTRGNYNKLVVILGTLTAFAPLSIDMYLPGLPAIAREFNVPTSMAQQTLAVFFIGLSLGQALYGPISDRIGRRRPLIFGCVLYVVASMGCALAPTIGSLIALRLAQALGGCAGVVIARSVVRDLFDQRESARMYSFLMLIMGLAPILAPLLGGQVLAAFGWRAIFVVLAGFGVLCVLTGADSVCRKRCRRNGESQRASARHCVCMPDCWPMSTSWALCWQAGWLRHACSPTSQARRSCLSN